jgi:uncharacterized protein
MFIGREQELKKLQDSLESSKSEAILIYGRRRVGKTYLVNEALKKEKSTIVLQYVFRDVSAQINIMEFGKYLAQFFNEPFLNFDNLDNILKYLATKIKGKRAILVLDEYPFLRKKDAGIDSFFQRFIDETFSSLQLKIIFLGSYLDIMTSMIEKEAPLFGRMNLILKIETFDYYDASLFLDKQVSIEDKFKYYAVFGGLGFTLSLINNKKSFEENLLSLFIESDSILERELNTIVQTEISKESDAKYLFELIAHGIHNYSDLEKHFKSEGLGNNIAYLMNKLVDMSLIKKESHLNNNKRNSLYYLKDNLLDFYYSFLFKNINSRAVMSPKAFFKTIEESFEKVYLPRKFEDVSKEFLIRLNRKSTNPLFEEIGTYAYNDRYTKQNSQFDIVTRIKDEYTDYECKYLERLLNKNDYVEEVECIKKLDLSFSKVCFIVKKGVDKTFPKDVTYYKLIDFYKNPLD